MIPKLEKNSKKEFFFFLSKGGGGIQIECPSAMTLIN
jgi:hypothetical protein